MVVYRIGKTRHNRDLTGEGARLNGGRWNHILTPCLYTSQSRALAILEYTVDINIDDIPRALSVTTIEIAEDTILNISQSDLPGNWMQVPSPSSTKDFGSNILKAATAPIIKIPSIVVPQEFNYLLNPLHPDSKNFKILSVEDFIYDVRIKIT